MKKWEYLVVQLQMNYGKFDYSDLQKYGDMGWELVLVDSGYCAVFKRPKA